ncbi:MAG: CPBP family intramembrane metalloprotease [Candidatus Omnitrophica bacterium]|nr:CPBP family intramembrane metalloprotease [Candidatus Omnitrophota bacterium]
MLKRCFGSAKADWPYAVMLFFIITITALALIAEKDVKTKKSPASQSMAVNAVDENVFAQHQEKIKGLLKENISLYLILLSVNLLLLAVFLGGILLDIMLIFKVKRNDALIIRTREHAAVRWGMADCVRFAIIFYSFAYIFMIAEGMMVHTFKRFDRDNLLLILNATVTDGMGILFVLYYVTSIHKHRIDAIGLTAKNFFRNVYYGITGYVAIVPLLGLTLVITSIILQMVHMRPPVQPIVDLLMEEKKGAVLVYSAVFAAVCGPIMEEIAFRGFMYNAFKKKWGVLWGIMGTSVLFSLLHAHPVGFVPIMILGILLAYLYEKTGSLVPSMTVHIVHNLASLGMVFLMKGMNL